MTTETDQEPNPDVMDLLALEQIDVNLYRAGTTFRRGPYGLYGGQVAAQALLAAGSTVPDGRLPHSLHSYFLRRGDASRPTILHVHRDRDGGSYSARRVVAVQDGEVIFNLSASFHVDEEGVNYQVVPSADDVPEPESLPEGGSPWWREAGMDVRPAPSPYDNPRWPTRGWLRYLKPLPDDWLVHACVLTWLSDLFTGTSAVPGPPVVNSSSLDHVLWFHRNVRIDDWVLMDLHPVSVAGGRGLYTGGMFSRTGIHAVTVSQEALFRPART